MNLLILPSESSVKCRQCQVEFVSFYRAFITLNGEIQGHERMMKWECSLLLDHENLQLLGTPSGLTSKPTTLGYEITMPVHSSPRFTHLRVLMRNSQILVQQLAPSREVIRAHTLNSLGGSFTFHDAVGSPLLWLGKISARPGLCGPS